MPTSGSMIDTFNNSVVPGFQTKCKTVILHGNLNMQIGIISEAVQQKRGTTFLASLRFI